MPCSLRVSVQTDLDDQAAELKSSEESSKRAMADAARLADELRQEQEHGAQIEKMRRSLETQVKELQARLDEAGAQAMKGGKRSLAKLETRVRELETEYDAEQRRHADAQKAMRKQERRLKELLFQADEDRKSHDRLQDVVDKLQGKIKTYKRQVEEAVSVQSQRLSNSPNTV